MNKYTFTVILTGYGENEDDAWRDATHAADLDSDPAPDEFEVEECEPDFDPLP
jgi:hypothetical protein